MMPRGKNLFAAFPGVLLAGLAGLVVLCAGCRSEAYYQDRAVQRAREYLLDNAPELTTEQLYFVKYNRPLLLTGEILPAAGPGTAVSGNMCPGLRKSSGRAEASTHLRAVTDLSAAEMPVVVDSWSIDTVNAVQ